MKSTKYYLGFLLLLGIFLKSIILLFPNKQYGIEMFLLFAGLILTGIPHGAIDHLVAKGNYADGNKNFNLVNFIFYYVILILIYGCAWWLLPGLSMWFFIFLTAFHFGVTDMNYFGNNNSYAIFIYGIGLTAWLLFPHQKELTNWVQLILPTKDPFFVILSYIYKIPKVIYILVIGIISIPLKNIKTEWILFMLLIILCNQLGLIGGFSFYFSGWHSWRAFNDIKNYTNSKYTITQLWKKAIPFTLISFIGLIIVYMITPDSVWKNFGAPALIIMISLLTLPHMRVMQNIYQRRTKNLD